jgi:hypothetical protein
MERVQGEWEIPKKRTILALPLSTRERRDPVAPGKPDAHIETTSS